MYKKLIHLVYFVLVLGLVGSASVASAETVAYWRFDDVGDPVIDVPPGTVAPGNALPDSDGQTVWRKAVHDHSGNGNHLTTWDYDWAGFEWSSDVPEATVPLTGASNALSMVNAGDWPAMMTWSERSSPSGTNIESITPAAFTIEASFKMNVLNGYHTIVGRDGMNAATSDARMAPLYFQARPDNVVAIIFADLAGFDHIAQSPINTITTGRWYNMVAVSDGSTLSLYLDNKLVAQTDMTLSGSTNTALAIGSGLGGDWEAGTWTISRGLWDGGHVDRLFGYVDEVRISDTALRMAEFLFVPQKASNPDPAHLAVDVPVDANLTWIRGLGAVQEEVYFGTDPCALPKVADITDLQTNPPLYNPGDPNLIASTTYYWQIVEVNGPDRYEGPVWEFTTVRGEAQPDHPGDGALIPGDVLGGGNISTNLEFVPGPTTVEYKGYFSEDYSKVLSRHADANLGPPPYAGWEGYEYTFWVGNPGVPPITDTLVRGRKYYWTVDSNDAKGNTFYGDVWEFTIQDFKTGCPNPPNEAVFISVTPLLSWCPPVKVEDYDIYIGTNWEDVNNAEYDPYNPPPELLDTRSEPNCQVVNPLPYNTKIYWRVDVIVGRGPPDFIPTEFYKGDVWCFTTLPKNVGEVRMDLWWNLTNADSANRNSLSWLYTHPNFPGQPDETSMLNSFDSGEGLGNDYGGMIHGWLHPAYSGDYTFWLSSDDEGDLFLSTDYRPANMVRIAYVEGWTGGHYDWYNEGGGPTDPALQQSVPISLVAGQKYYIRATWKDGVGGDYCTVAWQGPDQPLAPVGGSASAVIPGSRLSPFVQLWAHDPDPSDGQASVPVSYNLRWGPGDHAALHDVYIGTDKAAVEDANVITPTIYKGRIGPNTLSVLLDAATLYYWRVDEVNLAGPDPCLWKGDTWTFRTVGAAGGLLGLYYHWDGYQPDIPIGPPNPFQIFVMSRIDPEVNFNWVNGTPDPNVNVNYFASRWVGHVECPVDANYTFTTECDDGARLIIDGQEIVPAEAWSQGGMRLYSGNIVLSAGLHDIEMHQYEREGDAGARLAWSAIPTNPSDYPIFGLSTSRQIIPSIWLWPPLFASGPRPPDGATIEDRKPALEWIAGVNVKAIGGHELYFSENRDDVNERNPAVKEIWSDPCRPYPAGPRLELGTTYYWLVDEVGLTERWDARTVWSFTISECLSLDNMEDYNDRGELRRVWRDGNADVVWGGTYPYLSLVQGGSSGSNLNVSTAVGAPSNGANGPIPPTPLNYEAMVLRYDNDGWTYTGLPGEEDWIYDAPYYSEIEANTVGDNSLDVGQTWASEGVKSLSLSFQGHPLSDGGYNAAGWPAYTVKGRGRNIQGRHDEFYFLSQYPFVGDGEISVRVLSMDNTDPWAKAGVMIREKWTPYSKYAAVFMTAGQGVTFQYRDVEDGPTQTVTKPGVTLPQYIRLVRDISGAFEAQHSANGFAWEDVNAPDASPVYPDIPMGTIDDPNIYVGTAVTSHNANQTCSADFNTVYIDPLPTNWVFGNIGTNDPEQLYVALSDGVNTFVVEHNDVNAATLTSWQEWNIALSDFTTVDLDAVKKVYIGFGDRDDPCLGGSGAVYVDDIRSCPPRCIPELAKPLYDIAQPYDCIVNELDLALVGMDWLLRDEVIDTVAPSDVNLTARYQFEGDYLDSSVHLNHLTDPCGTAPGFDTGVVGAQALALDGVEDYLVVSGVGIDGSTPRTICCWVKADSMVIADFSLIFGFTGMPDGSGGDGSHFNIGYTSTYISQLEPSFIAHVWGWEEQILPLDVDVWHHFAMTYDGTTIAYFADGIEVDTDPDKSNVRNLVHGDRVHVGKRATSNNCFPGKVDDARIYSVVLSDAEIAYLATQGALTLHLPIASDADVYQGEAPGNQWINFKDYALIADKYLEEILWPAP